MKVASFKRGQSPFVQGISKKGLLLEAGRVIGWMPHGSSLPRPNPKKNLSASRHHIYFSRSNAVVVFQPRPAAGSRLVGTVLTVRHVIM